MRINVQSPNLDKLKSLLEKQQELCRELMQNAEAIGNTLTVINAKEIQPPAATDG